MCDSICAKPNYSKDSQRKSISMRTNISHAWKNWAPETVCGKRKTEIPQSSSRSLWIYCFSMQNNLFFIDSYVELIKIVFKVNTHIIQIAIAFSQIFKEFFFLSFMYWIGLNVAVNERIYTHFYLQLLCIFCVLREGETKFKILHMMFVWRRVSSSTS